MPDPTRPALRHWKVLAAAPIIILAGLAFIGAWDDLRPRAWIARIAALASASMISVFVLNARNIDFTTQIKTRAGGRITAFVVGLLGLVLVPPDRVDMKSTALFAVLMVAIVWEVRLRNRTAG